MGNNNMLKPSESLRKILEVAKHEAANKGLLKVYPETVFKLIFKSIFTNPEDFISDEKEFVLSQFISGNESDISNLAYIDETLEDCLNTIVSKCEEIESVHSTIDGSNSSQDPVETWDNDLSDLISTISTIKSMDSGKFDSTNPHYDGDVITIIDFIWYTLQKYYVNGNNNSDIFTYWEEMTSDIERFLILRFNVKNFNWGENNDVFGGNPNGKTIYDSLDQCSLGGITFIIGDESDGIGLLFTINNIRKTEFGKKDSNLSIFGTKDAGASEVRDEDLASEAEANDPYRNMSNSNDNDQYSMAGTSSGINIKRASEDSKTKYLDTYGENLVEEAKKGKYDPVVGRDTDLQRLIEILCCRKKKNAVLLGDPGCGKTAIVELLAQKIADRDVPSYLIDKKVYSLNLNNLVAGTKFRGEFEERLQHIIDEVRANKDIIVFIDELHNLIGNGGTAGQGDAANILKPDLARGEFQCIGATTIEEYKKSIEKDGALKRRFQPVFVDEPSISETKAILSGIKEKYSEYHEVNYSDEIVNKIVDLSSRYVTDTFFPDKAINVMDISGSLAKLNNKVETVSELRIREIDEELINIINDKNNAVINDDIDEAERLSIIENCLNNEKAALQKKVSTERNDLRTPVTVDNVAEVISRISKVPVDNILSSDMSRLKNVKANLSKYIIGQQEAVNTVILSLQKSLMGIRDPKKPMASLFFVGPTGTGKTLICKEIAKQFFGGEKSLIRVDMGEYQNLGDKSKLLGTSAGFIGYDEPSIFDKVRRRPYSVVLFDEVEKADREIFNVLLNILDEGYITLGNGTKVDFSNCIVVFTSNTGTKELALHGSGIGYSNTNKYDDPKVIKSVVMKAVKKDFRPEFINRLNSIVVFNKLSKEDLDKIFYLELAKLNNSIVSSNITITVSDDVKNKIIEECDTEYGARDLQRKLSSWVQDAVCSGILDENLDISSNSSYLANVSLVDGEPKVEFKENVTISE